METIYWILSIMSITGTIFNNYQRKEGFYFWFFANVLWTGVYLHQGFYPQAFQFAVFALFTVQGFFKWCQIERETTKSTKAFRGYL